MKKTLALAATMVLGLTLLACTPTEQVAVDCLNRATVVDKSYTNFTEQYRKGPGLADDTTVNALGSQWSVPISTTDNHHDYPIYFHGDDGENICFVGGYITQEHDHDDPWQTWKVGSAYTAKIPDPTVVGTEVFNVGDGFRLASKHSTLWRLQGVKAGQVHDDCVENDKMRSGVIDDAYFASCYVFYSARGDQQATLDGSANTVTITNTLVNMAEIPNDGSPAMGPIWKMGNGVYFNGPARTGVSPMLSLDNVTIRVDRRPSEGKLGIPRYDIDQDNVPNDPDDPYYLEPCEEATNTLVVTGDAYLLPNEEASYVNSGCFDILYGAEGDAFWDAKVADWIEAHTYE